MRKKLSTLMAAGALVVGAQQSQAINFLDADDFTDGNLTTGLLISAGDTATGSFDIVPSADDGTSSFTVAGVYGPPTGGATFTSSLGFNPATDTIVSGSGSMGFWFQVGPNANYAVTIEDIDLSTVGNGSSITYNVLLQTGLSLDIEAALQADGSVDYEISAQNAANADIYLQYAYLEVDANRRPPVTTPDGGGTAMLVGLGCLGIAGLRRKLS